MDSNVGASGELEATVTHHPPGGAATSETPKVDEAAAGDKEKPERLSAGTSFGYALVLVVLLWLVYGAAYAAASHLIRHDFRPFLIAAALFVVLWALIHTAPPPEKG